MEKVAAVIFVMFLVCIIWPEHVANAIRLITAAWK